MSRFWKIALIALIFTMLCAIALSGVPYGDPYYRFIAKQNSKLRPSEIAIIINANRKYSTKYSVSMYWHICKTAWESGFKKGVGDTFYGDKIEPCYGIERLQVKTVLGMIAKTYTRERVKYLLQNDYSFAIEQSYKLDSLNQRSAFRMGYKTAYNNRVVGLILYNAGLGNWQKYHYNLGKYLKRGNKLEDLSVREWRRYSLGFHEVYSLNYYVNILDESDRLQKFIQNQVEPIPNISVTPIIEVATPITQQDVAKKRKRR